MSIDAIDRLIFECREASIDAARVDAACSQLASYRRHMAEMEAERAKLQKSLAAALDGERFFARSHVELAKVLDVDPAMLEDGPACLHDAIVALKDKAARTEQESAAACGRMRQQKAELRERAEKAEAERDELRAEHAKASAWLAAALHACAATEAERDDLRARLARAVELLRLVDRAELVQAHPDVRAFLDSKQAREEER